MARKFLTNIDLTKNELQNVVIHKLATAPSSPVEGQIYYNTTDERWYLRLSGSWKDVTGRLDDIISGTTALTVTDNSDGTLTLEIANATQADAGLMSAADKTKLDGLANISGIRVVGTLDASTNPDYPAAEAGEAYYITAAGKVGGASGEDVSEGDLVVALNDNAGGDEATVGDDWFVIERNIEYATETTAGYIRIATQAEADAGTDNTTAITPAKLKAVLDAQDAAGQYAANVGDGTNTSYAVSHGLNSSDVIVQVYDNSTLDQVEVDVIHTDADTITLGFTQAPAVDAYRVTIKG